jgi:Pilin (bacterial filament)
MNKTLVILILAVIVLSLNFVFTDKKKVDLTDPAKVLQGLSQGVNYKMAVFEYWKEKNVLPDAETWIKEGKHFEVDTSKSLVKDIEVGVGAPGSVTVTFMNKETIKLEKDVEGKKIILIPEVKGERLIWKCIGTMYKDYMPKKCRQDVLQDSTVEEDQ